jgi:molybdopterin-guanine dinucleotide biosynthesis protein A
MSTEANAAGIVLCGGRSTRMGRPKEWLPIGDETMLGRVVRIVGEVVSPVVVVAAVGQELPPLPLRVEIVRDAEPDLGPMQGLVTGLRHLDGRADAAYVSSCDVPLLRADFVRRMIGWLGNNDIAVPMIEDRIHALAGVYRIRVLTEAERLRAEGNRRMTALMTRVSTKLLAPEELIDADPNLESLRNVNTPEEYSALRPS